MRFLFVFLIMASGFCGFGQSTMRFQSYDMSHGLSNANIKCFYQDDKGYIWIGTQDGLNRFDGRNFKQFKTNPSDPNSICGNHISCIFEDHLKRMWIGTRDGGICYFDVHSQNFIPYHFPKAKRHAEPPKQVNAIGQDADKNIWVGFEKFPLFRFSTNSQSTEYLEEIDNEFHEQADRIYEFHLDKHGNFFTTPHGRGLGLLIEKKWEFPPNDFIPKLGNTISAFASDDSLLFFGGWSNKLYAYSIKSKKFSVKQNGLCSNMPEEEIYSLLNNGDEIWIGTRFGGLVVMNKKTGESQQYKPVAYDNYSLRSNQVNTIFNDKDARVWIGTERGISVFDPLKYQFEVNYLAGDIRNADAQEKVNCFADINGKLMIGTNLGLRVCLKNAPSKLIKLRAFNQDLQVHSIYQDSKDRVWVGSHKSIQSLNTTDFSLDFLNTYHRPYHANEYSFRLHEFSSSRTKFITEGIVNGRHLLLISLYGNGFGLFDFNTLSGLSEIIAVTNSQSEILPTENLFRKIYIDKSQNVWFLGASKGLLYNAKPTTNHHSQNLFESIGKKTMVQSYNYDINEYTGKRVPLPEQTGNYSAYDLLENDDGTFYLTTVNEGLFLIEKKDTLVSATAVPTPNKSLEGLCNDNDGNLWIIASGGLDFYNKKADKWYRFDQRDGIPSSGLSGYFYKRKNGNILAGGAGFYIEFNPSQIKFNNTPPPVEITGLKIMNEPRDSLLRGSNPALDYEDNFVSFEFAALNFTNTEQNNFAYKLTPTNTDWIQAGTNTSADYTNLPGGNYTFEVKGTNNHGFWSEKPAQFSFSIIPPFWQRTWFWPLLSALFIAFVFAIYFIRVKRLHKLQLVQLQVEIEAQEKERKRLAQDLHDDLGTRMSALKLYMNTLEYHLNNDEKAHKVSSSAQALLDDSIKDLRGMLTNLSPNTVSKYGYFRATEDLAVRLSQTGLFNINCEFNAPESRFSGQTELALYRITQELINNALKHAKCDNINLKVELSEKQIAFEYNDNGVGFDLNKPTNGHKDGENGQITGLGLKNIKNRVKLEGGNLEWKSALNQGLKLTIFIPRKQSKNDD